MTGTYHGNPAKHFGSQIRKERTTRGWTLPDLARETGLNAGHLSRIERGERPPTEKIALAMDGAFPERDGWFTDFYRDSQGWSPPGFRNWREQEDQATSLRAWATGGVVHGLVQTEAYARAQLETVPGIPDEVVSARLAARMERQRRVLRSEGAPSLWVLVDALALTREVGSPEIMTTQMDRLLELAALPDVTIQVVPAVIHPATGSELIVTPDAAYTEHAVGSYVYTEPEVVSALDRIITTLQAESYRASESRQMIERFRDIWARGVNPLTAMLKGDPASK